MPDVDILPPFRAYAGNGPCVFVSYAHKDVRFVFPDIRELHNQGLHIWYDEGIDPGNEWPEEIAKALIRASHFLVFLSANAVSSRNVRNEINLALSRKKTVIVVYIEETALPPGLELRLGDIQAIMRYRMAKATYLQKLLKTLPKTAKTDGAVESRTACGGELEDHPPAVGASAPSSGAATLSRPPRLRSPGVASHEIRRHGISCRLNGFHRKGHRRSADQAGPDGNVRRKLGSCMGKAPGPG